MTGRGFAPAVVGAMWRHEVRRYARDRTQVFGGVSRTVLWLVILGVGLGAALGGVDGVPYAAFVLPGVITLNVLFSSLQCAVALVRDRESGILREVLVSPAPLRAVALGKLLGGATIALPQGSIPLLFAPLVGVALDAGSVLIAWGVMFLMGLAFTGLGVVLATRMASLESFGSISNGVIQPLFFLSGAVFPVRSGRLIGQHLVGQWVGVPVWLEIVVGLNPVSYQVDLLRAVLVGSGQWSTQVGLVVTAALPVAAVVLALWTAPSVVAPRRSSHR